MNGYHFYTFRKNKDLFIFLIKGNLKREKEANLENGKEKRN